jgi:hypothetical protein
MEEEQPRWPGESGRSTELGESGRSTEPGVAELAGCRAAVAEATGAVRGLRALLWQATSADLGPLMRELDALVTAGEAGRCAVLGEAIDRGETGPRSSPTAAAQWLRRWAPSLRGGGAASVVAVTTAFSKPANAPIQAAVDAGRLPVRAAATVVAEHDRLQPLLGPHAQEPVLTALIDLAADGGAAACRRVRPFLLARHGADGALQEQQDAARRFAALSSPSVSDGSAPGLDLFEYRLTLDVEAKEILEAAIGPLSAPRPTDAGPDLRPAQQRRAEALIEVVQRAVAAGESVPATARAQLFVSVDYETLTAGLRGAGATVGGVTAGTLLGPETVRRLACDAAIIPIVLGSDGQVLDWGRERRLFTAAQTKRLWLRDGGCTYPGCDRPPHWTQAHHLVHWADGGATDLPNAALLCRHHHTTVHTRRLAGCVVEEATGARVDWDLAPGSYDTLLADRQSRRRA